MLPGCAFFEEFLEDRESAAGCAGGSTKLVPDGWYWPGTKSRGCPEAFAGAWFW